MWPWTESLWGSSKTTRAGGRHTNGTEARGEEGSGHRDSDSGRWSRRSGEGSSSSRKRGWEEAEWWAEEEDRVLLGLDDRNTNQQHHHQHFVEGGEREGSTAYPHPLYSHHQHHLGRRHQYHRDPDPEEAGVAKRFKGAQGQQRSSGGFFTSRGGKQQHWFGGGRGSSRRGEEEERERGKGGKGAISLLGRILSGVAAFAFSPSSVAEDVATHQQRGFPLNKQKGEENQASLASAGGSSSLSGTRATASGTFSYKACPQPLYGTPSGAVFPSRYDSSYRTTSSVRGGGKESGRRRKRVLLEQQKINHTPYQGPASVVNNWSTRQSKSTVTGSGPVNGYAPSPSVFVNSSSSSGLSHSHRRGSDSNKNNRRESTSLSLSGYGTASSPFLIGFGSGSVEDPIVIESSGGDLEFDKRSFQNQRPQQFASVTKGDSSGWFSGPASLGKEGGQVSREPGTSAQPHTESINRARSLEFDSRVRRNQRENALKFENRTFQSHRDKQRKELGILHSGQAKTKGSLEGLGIAGGCFVIPRVDKRPVTYSLNTLPKSYQRNLAMDGVMIKEDKEKLLELLENITIEDKEVSNITGRAAAKAQLADVDSGKKSLTPTSSNAEAIANARSQQLKPRGANYGERGSVADRIQAPPPAVSNYAEFSYHRHEEVIEEKEIEKAFDRPQKSEKGKTPLIADFFYPHQEDIEEKEPEQAFDRPRRSEKGKKPLFADVARAGVGKGREGSMRDRKLVAAELELDLRRQSRAIEEAKVKSESEHIRKTLEERLVKSKAEKKSLFGDPVRPENLIKSSNLRWGVEAEQEKERLEKEKSDRIRKVESQDEEIDVSIKERMKIASEKTNPFPELPEGAEEMVDSAFEPGDKDELLSKGMKGLQVTRGDLETLQGLNWLNDEVINFYMQLLTLRTDKSHEKGGAGNLPSAYFHNTFFYETLSQKGYDKVKRWTRRVNLFEKDIVIVPVHLQMHWCLAVIYIQEKRIEYFDSLGGSNAKCFKLLKEYLSKESEDKLKKKLDTSDWKCVRRTDIPAQHNGSDCGVFMCKFADYVSRGTEFDFSQAHMPYFRRRMVYELLSKKLLW
eukprot:Nk52_evm7s2542 gene=Nk52_evmTU7s2542